MQRARKEKLRSTSTYTYRCRAIDTQASSRALCHERGREECARLRTHTHKGRAQQQWRGAITAGMRLSRSALHCSLVRRPFSGSENVCAARALTFEFDRLRFGCTPGLESMKLNPEDPPQRESMYFRSVCIQGGASFLNYRG